MQNYLPSNALLAKQQNTQPACLRTSKLTLVNGSSSSSGSRAGGSGELSVNYTVVELLFRASRSDNEDCLIVR